MLLTFLQWLTIISGLFLVIFLILGLFVGKGGKGGK